MLLTLLLILNYPYQTKKGVQIGTPFLMIYNYKQFHIYGDP